MAIIVKTNPTLTKVAAAVDDTRKLIDRKLDEVSEKIETARREIRYLALEEGMLKQCPFVSFFLIFAEQYDN